MAVEVKLPLLLTSALKAECNTALTKRLYARIKVSGRGPTESMNVKWQYFVRKQRET